MLGGFLAAGRPFSRPAGVLSALLLISGALWALLPSIAGNAVTRGPVAIPNPAAVPPVELLESGVTIVVSAEAPWHLVVDTVPPTEPARLLWLQGRPVHRTTDGQAVTVDGAGGVIRFDTELRARRLPVRSGGRDIISVAPADRGHWLATANGDVLRADSDGRLVAFGGGPGREGVAARSPFDYVELASDPAAASTAWLVRSQQQFSYNWYQDGVPPVFVRLDTAGAVVGEVGASTVPAHVLLADLANAGRIAVEDGVIFYAPFIRDEILAFTERGDTLWIARRGLEHSTPDPKFEIDGGRPVIDYAPVNLGVAIGPDDRLYVLSTAGRSESAEGRTHVDVFDKANGRLLRSGKVPSLLPTIAVDGDGRLYSLEPFRLLTGVAAREREAVAAFDLERLAGGRMSNEALIGHVTLVNVWASWCGPCRTEMPALDSLWKGIDDPEFAFVTFNEDLSVNAARSFMDEFGFDFPVLLGRGKLRDRFHYVGLPFTMLVDRRGRVVERWLGFAGEAQLDAIRALIRAELTFGDGGARRHTVSAHTGH